MKKNFAYTITGSKKISAVYDGKPFTVETDHPNYDKIIQALNNEDYDSIPVLADIAIGVKEYVKSESETVSVVDGAIVYKGTVIHNSLTSRILDFMREGLPVKPLLRFLENLLENPSNRALNELYDFLQVGELPITEDGHFLAFKNIRGDWKDIYTGTFDNSIGAKPEMPRNQVDDVSSRTCSRGLHFCSVAYLPHYSWASNGRTIVVKVNPRDVVSIPTDYNNSKARGCKYEVVAEYTPEMKKAAADKKSSNGFTEKVYSSKNGGIYGVKPNGHRYYNARGEGGRFVKKS